MGRTSQRQHASSQSTPAASVLRTLRTLCSRVSLFALLFLSLGAIGCGPPALAPAPADSDAVIEVPVTVHVATHAGAPVVSESQIVANIRRTNRALAPYRMRVRVARLRTMGSGHATINTETERLELARRAHHDGTLHIFFVDSVSMEEHASADDADARLSGLHWRYAGMRTQMYERQYLVIAQDAPNTTFAHEVGHAFGLDHHKSFENIMCSCRRGADTYFTPRQGQQMRDGAVAWMSAQRR